MTMSISNKHNNQEPSMHEHSPARIKVFKLTTFQKHGLAQCFKKPVI